MSYLECPNTPMPDMQKGIISFWFREVSKQQARPRPRIDWPQGFWTDANASETMVPPNAQYTFSGLKVAGTVMGPDPKYKNCVDYYNAYGLKAGGLFFGDLFLTPACCWIPNPPPLVLNTMTLKKEGGFISPVSSYGDALTMMSEYGVRVLLAFGDPGIDYNYCSWRVENPGVLDAVQLVTAGLPAEFLWWNISPPYTPYNPHVGDGGKFHVRNYRLNEPTPKGKVPPCIIGIDDGGHLFINLQTRTQPTYKGMAFECTKVSTMWFEAAAGNPPAHNPDGTLIVDHSFRYYGPYWNGYQFEHKDVSDKIMGCAPESFLIRQQRAIDIPTGGDPVITDGGWHHFLFSFDISGAVKVEVEQGPAPTPAPPVVPLVYPPLPPASGGTGGVITTKVSSSCKAWFALDDKNITDAQLQSSPMVHSGLPAGALPKLSGTQTSAIFDFGPCLGMARPAELGDNGILPRNAWLKGFGGLPRDGLQWFVANTPRIGDDGLFINLIVGTSNVGAVINIDSFAQRYGGTYGDFHWFYWTNREWMLTYGDAGPPLKAKFDPMHPDPTQDPSKFDVPTYDGSGYTIPVNGFPIAIPAGSSTVGITSGAMGGEAKLEEYNAGVEMAELQIWSGQTIDTGDENMRRLFIDYPKDKDGKPDKSKPARPVTPSEAAKVLGKPDVLLHGSGNWKRGRNTGTTGINPDGTENPAGQFNDVALIRKFKPEPELNQ